MTQGISTMLSHGHYTKSMESKNSTVWEMTHACVMPFGKSQSVGYKDMYSSLKRKNFFFLTYMYIYTSNRGLATMFCVDCDCHHH